MKNMRGQIFLNIIDSGFINTIMLKLESGMNGIIRSVVYHSPLNQMTKPEIKIVITICFLM